MRRKKETRRESFREPKQSRSLNAFSTIVKSFKLQNILTSDWLSGDHLSNISSVVDDLDKQIMKDSWEMRDLVQLVNTF